MGEWRVVAMDTESVGIGPGNRNGVAQVSMVDNCGITRNAYIWRNNITDYRTPYSGITPSVLEWRGRPFPEVKREVLDFIDDCVVVGHAIHHDLRGLGIVISEEYIRDTSKYWYFRQANRGRTPSLKYLAWRFLGKRIRWNGRHSCVEDATVTMQLYRLVEDQWEREYEDYDTDYSEYSESEYDSSDGYYY